MRNKSIEICTKSDLKCSCPVYSSLSFGLGNCSLFQLWKDAMSQVLLSLMISWGGLYTWSSYNRFYNRYVLIFNMPQLLHLRLLKYSQAQFVIFCRYEIDASVIIVTVPLLSLLPTVSIFGVIGYLSYARGVTPENALDGIKGPLSPLVAYSEALSQMWGDPVPWSIIIFATFFVLSTSAIVSCFDLITHSFSRLGKFVILISQLASWLVVLRILQAVETIRNFP